MPTTKAQVGAVRQLAAPGALWNILEMGEQHLEAPLDEELLEMLQPRGPETSVFAPTAIS